MNEEMKKGKTATAKLPKKTRRIILILVWLGAFSPLFGILFMLNQARPGIPSHEELANPPDKQASIIYTSDGMEMGRFWSVNRKSVNYNAISPYVISALIATEDQRFYDHAGVDVEGIGKSIDICCNGERRRRSKYNFTTIG